MTCPKCGGRERRGSCQGSGRVLYTGGPAPESHRARGAARLVAGTTGVGLIVGLLVLGGPRNLGSLVGWVRPANHRAALCNSAVAAQSALAVAAAPPLASGRASFSGSVSSASTGKPLPDAVVYLNRQSLHADETGRWEARVDGTTVVDVWISAPGFSPYHGQTKLPPGDGPVHVDPIEVALRSIFDAQDDFAAYPDHVPPRVTAFGADVGPGFSQVLPGNAESLTICGTPGSRDGRPAIDSAAWLGVPDDTVQQTAVSISSGEFRVTLPLAEGRGKYLLELNDRSGSAVLKVPLFVGTPYTFEPPPAFSDRLSGSESVEQGFATLNDVRLRHGLPTLQPDPRLATIAEAHIRDWGGRSGLGCPHCWSDRSQLPDHARAAGISVAKRPVPPSFSDPDSLMTFGRFTYEVAEGITHGVAGGEASIQALFDSPAHRSDLLGDYSHVGIADSGQGPTRYFVIEYAKET